MKRVTYALLVAALAAACSTNTWARAFPGGGQQGGQPPAASAQQQPPLTEKEVHDLVKKNKKHLDTIAATVNQRGVDFEITPDIEKDLRKAGADDAFIATVKNQGPKERAALAQATGGGHISAEENDEFQAIRNELDPARKIELVKVFADKFPQSPLTTYAYFLAQGASLQKGDFGGMIDFGEKALELKPDNLNALMLMASLLPQPQVLQDEMNPEKRLEEAETDGKKALEIINGLAKQPEETDDVFNKRKGDYLQNVHAGLAMVHLQRAMQGLAGPDADELAKAEDEFKQSIAASDEQNPQTYFRLGEVYSSENKIPEAIQAFTKVSELSADNPPLKQLADQKVADLKKKAGPASDKGHSPGAKNVTPAAKDGGKVQASNKTCKEGALKEAQVLDLVVNKVPEPRLLTLVKERGICFPVTGEIATRLKDNGATDELISVLRGAQ